jgi:predicted dehydrogenase
MDRRTFIGTTGKAGLAFTIVPRHVLGRGYLAPSDKLNVACIGVGGMGGSDVRGMAALADVNIYALCDVDQLRAHDMHVAHPQARKYRDFREMLDKEQANIDAVTVSTPDHTHAPAALMALRLNKHVYCQKPLARTVSEIRALMTAAREKPRLATQMGNQGHAGDGTRLIREWVEAGLIGTVREVHYWTDRPIWPQALDRPSDAHNVPPTLDWNLWLGPAPERPYHPAYAPFRWRGWWDYGTGAMGDIACHAMDAAVWTFGLRYPRSVVPDSTALFAETAPRASRVEYDFRTSAGAPLKIVWRDGSFLPPRPAGFPLDVRWPPNNDGGQLWIGDRGMLIADMYGNGPRLLDARRDAEVKATPLPVKYPRTRGVYAEFVAAAKAGTQPGSNFAGHAGPLTEMVALGNLAVRAGRAIELDERDGSLKTAGIPAEWVTPVYRAGW